MAITPDQALEMSQEESTEITRLEKKIDRILSGAYLGERLTIDFAQLGISAMSGRIFRQLKANYNKAGWVVERDESQKDGQWLVFEAKIN